MLSAAPESCAIEREKRERERDQRERERERERERRKEQRAKKREIFLVEQFEAYSTGVPGFGSLFFLSLLLLMFVFRPFCLFLDDLCGGCGVVPHSGDQNNKPKTPRESLVSPLHWRSRPKLAKSYEFPYLYFVVSCVWVWGVRQVKAGRPSFCRKFRLETKLPLNSGVRTKNIGLYWRVLLWREISRILPCCHACNSFYWDFWAYYFWVFPRSLT